MFSLGVFSLESSFDTNIHKSSLETCMKHTLWIWLAGGWCTHIRGEPTGLRNTSILVFSSKLWFQLKIYTKETYAENCHGVEQSSQVWNELCDWHKTRCLTGLNLIPTTCLRSHYHATHGYIKLSECCFRRCARKDMVIWVICCQEYGFRAW